MTPRTLLMFVGALALTLVLAACAGQKDGPATTAATSREEASGPPATATAQPTQAGRPQIRTSLEGTCSLTPTGAAIRVEYTVTAVGATMLTRVKLIEDGREVDDSGTLEQRQFRRVSVFPVEPGVQRTYRLAAESQAGSAANVQTTVRCGTVATPTSGPRA